MKIQLITVGKLKEKYLVRGVEEYLKRLGSYAKLTISEVKDSPLPSNLHQAEIEKVTEQEADRIESTLSTNSHLIVLDPKGKQFTSEQFADYLQQKMLMGNSKFTFVIGGTLGIANRLRQKSDLLLSFSKLTFPHQLMRLILVEQLYRAAKINNNEPYHH